MLTPVAITLVIGASIQQGFRKKTPTLRNVLQGGAYCPEQQTGMSIPLFQAKSAAIAQALSEDITSRGNAVLVTLRSSPIARVFDGRRYETAIPDIPTANEDPTGGDEQLNHHLALSAASLGLIAVSAWFSPLAPLLFTPVMVYLEWPIYQAAWQDITERRGIKIDGLMGIFITGAWLVGAYVASIFSIFTYLLARKITLQTKDRSQKSLVHLFDQQPQTVFLLVNGVEVEMPFASVKAGDTVVVYAGQAIPVDGRVIAGQAVVDQHRLTGEARAVEKAIGDTVLAATLMTRGQLHIEVDKAGHSTLAAQVAEILAETSDYHLAVEERGLALAEKSVLPSLFLGALALPLYGISTAFAALSAMPGVDMYFAGPLALLNFLHMAAQQGILVKDGRSLELLHTVDTVIFDKTGTLTVEQPEVIEVHLCHDSSADDVLLYAAAAEARQSHPIAQAILYAAEKRGLKLPEGDNIRFEAGYGVQIHIDNRLVRVGSQRFMTNEGLAIPSMLEPIQARCTAIGHSLVFVAVDDVVAGVLEMQPTIRPEAPAIIAALKAHGIQMYILSGDQVEPTRHLAERLGIDNYFANVLPVDKAGFVEQLQQQGRTVCFVGDGINDAIALKKAHVSISMRGATTIATDTAQIVLMSGSLHQLPALFDHAHRLESNLMTSFGLSLGTGGAIIGSVFVFHLGISAAIGIGTIGMVTTVGNAMMPLLMTMHKNSR